MKEIQEDRGGADAVSIVIAVDEDGPVMRDCIAEEGDGLLHAIEEEGIMEVLQGRGKEAGTSFGRGDAAGGEQRLEPGSGSRCTAGNKSGIHVIYKGGFPIAPLTPSVTMCLLKKHIFIGFRACGRDQGFPIALDLRKNERKDCDATAPPLQTEIRPLPSGCGASPPGMPRHNR